jgi:hypothetical protein
MTTSEILSLTIEVSKYLTPFFGSLFLMIIIVISLLILYLKKRIENIADEISAKTIKSFETKLSLVFSDDEIRKELLLYTARKSIDKQLQIYEEIWEIYRKYLHTWRLMQEENVNELNKLLFEIGNYRFDISKQTLFLGDKLYLQLDEIAFMMWECTQRKLDSFSNKNVNYNEMEVVLKEQELKDNLEKACDYLSAVLYSNQNILQYDFTEREKRKLSKERENFFEVDKK